YHRVHLPDNVTLTLMLGEVLEQLKQLEAVVDSWFLDGFSPSRNPQMWRLEVLAQVARLTATDGRLATFTTATQVREDLARVGFSLNRAPGFGSKRERLMGVYAGQPASACPGWFAPPLPVPDGPVTIVGGGVGGQCLASALRRRQRSVEIFDAGPAASSNPSVSVMPRLEAGSGPAGRFFWHAYRYALSYWGQRAEFHPCGALLLAGSGNDLTRFQRVVDLWRAGDGHLTLLDTQGVREASGLLRLDTPGGLWFPEAGIVRDYARGAVAQMRVQAVDRYETGWRVATSSGMSDHPTVVLATGADALGPATGLPVERWRGRAISLPATGASRSLRCAIFAAKYLHPPSGGRHWAGASFERDDATPPAPLTPAVLSAFPSLSLSTEASGEWSGWRLATPDRLPVAGPVLDMTTAAEKLRWVRGGRVGDAAPWLPGLYVVAGLGARGFTTGPLLGEWLASMLVGDPWPLPRDLALAVSTSRFLLRELRRGHTVPAPGRRA
ncbi:MAG: FAD-dependent 5-carboxymethylaminomethyl-2-thiouridine(34) oxidoreductase MnmC, partial [Pseudomonadota bacterium]